MLLRKHTTIWTTETAQMIMIAHTYIAILKMTNDTLLCWSCLWANHQKLFLILHEYVDKLIKLAEWRIGDDNVVVTIVYILKAHSFTSLWIVTTHADRTESPFFSLIKQILHKLAFHHIEAFLNLGICLSDINVLDCTFLREQITSQNIALFLKDYFFIVALIPVAWAKNPLAT